MIDDRHFAMGTIADTTDCSPGTCMIGSLDTIRGGATGRITNLKHYALLDISKIGNKVALLTTDINGDTVHLKLHTISNSGPPYASFDIGKDANLTQLKAAVSRMYAEVTGAVLGNKLDIELLKIHGSSLARMVLSPQGSNTIAAHYKSIDTVILFATDNDISIPWEWLRPSSGHRPKDMQLLSSVWKIIRWPTTDNSDIISGIMKYQPTEEKPGISSLLTFCNNPPTDDWRIQPPQRYGELVALANTKKTIHLIGHYSSAEDHIEIGNLKLSSETLNAYPLYGPTDIIISACSSGVAAMKKNIPLTLGKQDGTSTWAPLVSITEKQAYMLDNELYKYSIAHPTKSVADFFIDKCQEDPFYSLYVRYGISF